MSTSVIQTNFSYKWLSTAESVARDLSVHFGKAWVKADGDEFIVLVAPKNNTIFHANPGRGHLAYYENGAPAWDFSLPALLQPIANRP